MGIKKCSKCKIEKELSEFYKYKRSADGLQYHCKSCTNEITRAYYKTTKGKKSMASTKMKRSYGITLDDYDRMLEEQGGKCAICGTDESINPGTKKAGRFAVDHCHKTKEVRGLLCTNCNLGLGHFKDDLLTLSEAIKYLAKKR